MKKRNELPQDHLRVYDTIENAEGSITADKILLQIGQDEGYKRKLHEIIHSLVVDYKAPIGSSSKAEIAGYFIMKTPKQHLEAVKSLSSRVDNINKRAAAIKKSYSKLSGVDVTGMNFDEVREIMQGSELNEPKLNSENETDDI